MASRSRKSSPTLAEREEATRAKLVQRNAEHETENYMLLTDAQVRELAAGFVPEIVRDMARNICDWRDEDQRKATGHDADEGAQ